MCENIFLTILRSTVTNFTILHPVGHNHRPAGHGFTQPDIAEKGRDKLKNAFLNKIIVTIMTGDTKNILIPNFSSIEALLLSGRLAVVPLLLILFLKRAPFFMSGCVRKYFF